MSSVPLVRPVVVNTSRLAFIVGDEEVTLGRVRPSVDLALVDALARLQLVANRLGGTIVLRDPSRELRDLLDLVGLADLVR